MQLIIIFTFYQKTYKNGFFSKNKKNSYQENIANGFQKYTQSLQINTDKTPKTKKKLIKILAKDGFIVKQY